MEIDRRQFIQLAAASLGAHQLGKTTSALANSSDGLYAASRQLLNNKNEAALFDENGEIVQAVELPSRGHDVALRPFSSEFVMFARRPGRYGVVIPLDKKQTSQFFHAAANRHFYGHGIFSKDGRLLYSTENDYLNGVGVVGVRDATDGYKQVGEFATHGIGPHDMALMGDGETLVIANGGIETSPETGRQILNLADMSPSLVYVNRLSGELIEKCELQADLKQLSIRHLTIARNERVVFGCQFKGPAHERPPLIGFHDRGGIIKLRRATSDIHRKMKNYIGSVTVDQSGEIIAASSPRGNMVTFWGTQNLEYKGKRIIQDGCGVAKTQNDRNFLITSGDGDVVVTGLDENISRAKIPAVHFDNHTARIR